MSYLESTSDYSVGVATPSADADWIDVNRFATAVSKAIFAAARFVLAVPVSSVLLYTVLYDVSTLSLVSLTVLIYFSMDAASARFTIPSAKASSVKSFMLATVVFSAAAVLGCIFCRIDILFHLRPLRKILQSRTVFTDYYVGIHPHSRFSIAGGLLEGDVSRFGIIQVSIPAEHIPVYILIRAARHGIYPDPDIVFIRQVEGVYFC